MIIMFEVQKFSKHKCELRHIPN